MDANGTYAVAMGLPFLFWFCIFLLGILSLDALINFRKPWGVPCLAVLGTTATWYMGDILYSGIHEVRLLFSDTIMNSSLYQVILFALSYHLLARLTVSWFIPNADDSDGTIDLSLFESEAAQRQIQLALTFAFFAWLAVFLAAQLRGGFHLVASIFPPLADHRFDMWQRGRLGKSTGFLISAGSYMHIFLSSLFGIAAVLARRFRVRLAAALMVLVSWPYFFFGGARSVVLAVVVPSVAAYALLSRQKLLLKIAVLACLFMGVNVWFKVIIATRTVGVVESVRQMVDGSRDRGVVRTQRHLGLDMFKELCYINYFIENGRYEVNWGQRYFADLVNFVPRAIWKNKPAIGLDYALARGAKMQQGTGLVNVTISTGMIGQGVVNFGGFLGPVAAAFLMSLWTGVLARFWQQRRAFMRACLYFVGLGLTFNAGRDISLLVFFPFIFGLLLVKAFEHRHPAYSLAAVHAEERYGESEDSS